MGTDDGQSGYSADTAALLSIDPVSGRIIDCLDHLGADIRSTICYDAATQRYYFTSKGGKFFSVAVSEDGYFDRSSLKTLDLRGGQAIEGMSTSTPVVHNGRAYVGVSGAAQFEPYGGHSITVIDLKSFSIAYRCPTKGYPQTSGLLTKAYEKTGLVYVYFLENMSPGNLCVIRDAPGQKEALSIYDGKPITRAEVLFTPRGAQRQYAAWAEGTAAPKNIFVAIGDFFADLFGAAAAALGTAVFGTRIPVWGLLLFLGALLLLFLLLLRGKHTVRFETNGGEKIAAIRVRHGDTLDEDDLPVPVRAGRVFCGWYKDAALTEPWYFGEDEVRKSIRLYAKWI